VLPGTPETARVGAGVIVVVYLLLAPVHLVLMHGTARVTLVGAALVTAGLAALALRHDSPVDDRRSAGLVWLVCGAPLANGLLQLLVTGQLEQTTLVMLSVVAIGAVMTRPLHAVGLVVLGCLSWGAVVATTHPGPSDDTVHYVIQLLLACTLSAAVMGIRSMVGHRLATSETMLVEQLLKMEGVRTRLSESLTRFRGVFDDSPVGIALADEHGHFAQVNEALCRLMGRTPEELLGHSSLEFTHPDDRALHAAATRMIEEAEDGVGRVEKRYVRPGGEVRWAWLTFTHVEGPHGASWTLAHVQDVTVRKQADDALARTRETLRAAAEIARVTQLGGDPRPVVLEHLHALARAASVMLIEPTVPGRLVVTATCGLPRLRGVEFDLSERTATAHVWETGEPLFVADPAGHPLVSRRLTELSDAHSIQWQPVGLDGETHAVLAIVWDRTVPEVTEVERSVIEVLATETGAALTGERLRRELEDLSVRDPLTGLLNRRGWDREVAAMRSRSERDGAPLTFAIADLDHFKVYNDTHGHRAGDDLLAGFARAATAVLRDTDAIARWGGEEFVLALPGCDEAQAADTVARVRRAVPGSSTCSVGVARALPGESIGDCLLRADAALYRAKDRGRDCAVDAGVPVGGAALLTVPA
jgi:diguanylate cyclase (GGDEF)-like protein/PAS domain S-box-containing protein